MTASPSRSPTAPPAAAASSANAQPTPPFSIAQQTLSNLIDHKDRTLYDSLGGTRGIARCLLVNPAAGLCPPADYSTPTQTRLDDLAAASNAQGSWLSRLLPSSNKEGKHVKLKNAASNEDVPMEVQRSARTGANAAVSGTGTGLSLAATVSIAQDVIDEDESGGEPMPQGSTLDALDKRVEVFGENRLPEVKSATIFELMWDALQDKTLIFLTCAALVSLGIGLYEDFGMHHDDKGEKIKWVEGVAIIIAVTIVVLVASVNDWQKERQFRALSKRADDRQVKVVRNAQVQLISVYDLLVGDVLCLEPGDVIPVDAVLLSGHGVKCDESAATGESDAVKKAADKDVFLLSGSKVQEGTGRGLVVAVGEHSFHGRTMMSMRTEDQETPLQVKLNELAEDIAKLGGAAALLMLVVLLVKYLITTGMAGGFNPSGPNWQSVPKIVEAVTQIVITTITVLVVAVPEGLPLAVTLSLAFATKKMLADNNLVRVLAACEVMGNATTVCSDKTGTLTQNRMTVVRGIFGHTDATHESEGQMKHEDDAGRLKSLVTDDTLYALVHENIAVNSSAFLDTDAKSGATSFVGSKTETALLDMQRRAGVDFAAVRAKSKQVHVYPFSSANKWMGTLASPAPNHLRLHVKGASEIVLAHCASVYVPGQGPRPLTGDRLKHFQHVIDAYANQSLRTIALAYLDTDSERVPRDLVTNMPLVSTSGGDVSIVTSMELSAAIAGSENNLHAPPSPSGFRQGAGSQTLGVPGGSSTPNGLGPKARHTATWSGHPDGPGLVLLGIVGIEDPVRPGVPEAVQQCQRAGVFVRMVTGDNVATARAIAAKCGIYQRGGLVMEGRTFRKLPVDVMDRVIPRLQVLARSSPTDKQLLVERLKALGETVAVTGDGTNDGPALKLADVGFSMGIAGTEVAKEASAIILMDDNFASIVKALLWGRSVNDSVRKFLQFQLTVNVTAVVVTFVSAVSSSEQRSVLTAVQLLWVNLIMDSLAALALATEPPSNEMLNRLPDSKAAPLISYHMWKMVIGQASFQIIVNLLSLYLGPQIYGPKPSDRASLNTFVFNSFIFLQVFNEINCRRLDNQLNTFKGMHRNPYFISILILTVALQAVIVTFGASAFQTVPLSAGEWVASIAIGFLSIPVGIIVRLLPDWGYKPPVDDRVVMTKERLAWVGAISTVQTQLKVFNALRGSGRLQHLAAGGAASRRNVGSVSLSSRQDVFSSGAALTGGSNAALGGKAKGGGYTGPSSSAAASGGLLSPGASGGSPKKTKGGYFTIDDDA
ncbi:hypothetical protein BCR44DRAFT_53905 [Catenaria anguillulae PL171]|uniref:Calcium-transporting ATPase n=1 Tax=Catenaria anguillulae PL171 TaxID=765915 RepID=A0A1Y2HCR9_9FUNG|nr:hypothetical protein BCR44DRAFT_53905 [Catenaria anguillulae PL171]